MWVILSLEARLHELAKRDEGNDASTDATRKANQIRVRISKIESQIERTQRNLALAEGENQFRAVSAVFEELVAKKQTLERDLNAAEINPSQEIDVDSDISTAMEAAQFLTELASSEDGMAAATELIQATDARLFLSFQQIRQGKRELNRLKRGVVVFGNGEDPIEKYSGPTTPDKLKRKSPAVRNNKKARKTTNSDEEAKSLRNANRDDRI